RAVAVTTQQLVAWTGVAPERVDLTLQIAVQQHDRLDRQVVGDERGAVEEQRKVILDGRWEYPVADVFIQLAAGGVSLELLAEVLAEPRARLLVGRELARRQQVHVVHLVDRALRVDVERAQALDLVVEQVDTVGQGAAHRKQVDHAAAKAIFARRNDL